MLWGFKGMPKARNALTMLAKRLKKDFGELLKTGKHAPSYDTN